MPYLNVEEIESALENLAEAYPASCERVRLPHPTHEGRTCHALRLGTRPAGDTDGVLLLGGVHAREWVPPDALVALAADLLEAFGDGKGITWGKKRYTAEQVRQVFEGLSIFVFPCVNPDGRLWSQTADPDWRKNRRPGPDGRPQTVGVDLNRNFDFLWDHIQKFAPASQVATSDDPADKYVYRGPAPASEPEVQNVVWILDNWPRIRWMADVHSYGPDLLYSWGCDQNQTTDPGRNFQNAAYDGVRGLPNDTSYGEYIPATDLEVYTTVANRMQDAIEDVRDQHYDVIQAYSLYPTSGCSDDYAYARHFVTPGIGRVYGITVECGRRFQPSYQEGLKVMMDVCSGLLALCLSALEVSGSPTVALATPTVAFGNVSDGWQSARPVRFEVADGRAATFKVVWGPRTHAGPSGSFGLGHGREVSVPARPDGAPQEAIVWITGVGSNGRAQALGSVRIRCVETRQDWLIPLSMNLQTPSGRRKHRIRRPR